LKNAHLLCCAANRTAQRISIYASRFGFLRALHLNIFEQPQNMGFLISLRSDSRMLRVQGLLFEQKQIYRVKSEQDAL
jgi:hypothetical protein